MRAYRAHLNLLTLAVYSPRRRRPWLITPQQYRLVAVVGSGWSGSQRALADRAGYSPAGLHKALESLVTGGILAKLTVIGRKGRTSLRVRPGVRFLGIALQQGNDHLKVGTVSTLDVVSSLINEASTQMASVLRRPRARGLRAIGDLLVKPAEGTSRRGTFGQSQA